MSAAPAVAAASAPWWERSFGPLYATVYGHRDEAEARAAAPSIAKLLSLRPHDRLLDLGCGEGRYARAFATLGYRVTGVDLSHDLLEVARRKSPALPGAPTYVRADMRDLPFSMQFEGVASLFTSFGYFDDRADDARVLDGVARALVPGGRYLLDFLNADELRASLVAQDRREVAGHVILVRRAVDETCSGGPCVVKRVAVEDAATGREVGDFEERVRLYAPDELDAMLLAAGLEPVGPRHGGLDGRPFDASSPRFVRVASRRRGPRGPAR